MKKFFCLLIVCIFSLGTVALAVNDEPVNISCTEQNNVTQYIKLLHHSKNAVLKIMPHVEMNSENVNPNDRCLGVALYFANENGKEVVQRIVIRSPLVEFKEAKIGDHIDKFQENFNRVIDKDDVLAYRTFSYRDKALTAFYSPLDQKVQSVIITEDNSKKNKTYGIKLIDEEVNGVYLGKNLQYVLSEKIKNAALEYAIHENYPALSAKDKVAYYYNYADLNDDGNMEIIVYVKRTTGNAPTDNSVLVLSPYNGKHELLAKFNVASNPIIVSENKTNGWHDLVMGLSTRDGELVFVASKFGEKGYQNNTALQARLLEGQIVFGTAVIADDTTIKSGIKL